MGVSLKTEKQRVIGESTCRRAPAGGHGLFKVRNRKWTPPVNRPLAAKSSPEEAQTFKPIGGSVPMGYGHTL